MRYRPNKHDDWGIIRNANDDGIFAVVRRPLSEEEAAEHRANNTDPFEPLARKLMAAFATQPQSWRCFHCDEVFTDERCAREHFGFDQCAEPACRIKIGAERGLVTALRHAEKDAADAWAAIHNETTDAAKAYHAQASRHQEQLRVVEEAAYERGLRDARADQD